MNYRAIREFNLHRLQDAGIPAHPHLPLLDEEPRRSAEDLARRMVPLYCLAGLANGASGSAMLEWITDGNLGLLFEPTELALLARPELSKEEMNEVSWCQESLYAAAWALSLTKELTWPNKEADLEPLFPQMPPEVETAHFVRSSKLRSDQQLVEVDDLYYCLDASLRHDELWNGAPVESRYPMVQIVTGRRRTLDWIMQSCAWSDVALDI
jgi:hypothetical protein